MKKFLAALLLFASTQNIEAQWQVPTDNIPIGRGVGTGFNFLAPSTSGNIITSNGTSFSSVALSGDCTIVAAGAITCTKLNGVTYPAAVGASGNIIQSNGTSFSSVTIPSALSALGSTNGAILHVVGGVWTVTTTPTWTGASTFNAAVSLGGSATATTPATDDNDTSVATTAYVIGQASNTNPVINGTAAPGTATRWSRTDHVHPIDTSRAPLASPALTGNPTAPTATAGDSDTSIATTAFVQGELSGRFRNVRVAQSGNFTAASTDCGKLIALTFSNATAATPTMTLGAVAGYASDCVIGVKNESTSRGFRMNVSGLTGAGLQSILWPGQFKLFFITNGAWQVDRMEERWRVEPGTLKIFQVNNASGSDNNDCLGTGAGACTTIATTIGYVCHSFDGSNQVQIADSATPYRGPVLTEDCLGANQVNVLGNTASPGNVRVSTGGVGGSVIADCQDKCILVLDGVSFDESAAGVSAIRCRQGGSVMDINNVIWVTLAATSVGISTDRGCNINITGTNAVNTGMTAFALAGAPASSILFAGGGTTTFNGPITFSTTWQAANLASIQGGATFTVVGGVTTTTNTCIGSLNAVIHKNGTTVPGTQVCDQATSATSGAQVQ